MTDSTDNALKPCPFCGGVGHMAKDPDMNWGDFYSIKCGACRAKSPEFHASETCPIFFAQVRDAWNRRADLAPDPLRAVKVKPLVWEYHPAGAIAAPPTGFAYIIDTRMKGRVYSLKGFNPQREFSSMDEAKAAAQADYETRIRSALEPCDPLADARVWALVDAVQTALNRGVIWRDETEREFQTPMRCYEALHDALAAFDTGGKIDA